METKRMIRTLVALSAFALGATAVMAQNLAPIKERQEIMKKSDDDLKLLTKMTKGEAPYDAAKVSAAYAAMAESYPKTKGLFPDDSKTGEKSRASAKIWENRADFDEKLVAFIKVAGEAKAKATSESAFKEIHPAVVKACDNCHADYRIRRQQQPG
jgi:cytochrome c556